MVAESKKIVASVLVGGFLALAAAYMRYRCVLLSKRKKVGRVSDIFCTPSNLDQHYTFSRQNVLNLDSSLRISMIGEPKVSHSYLRSSKFLTCL